MRVHELLFILSAGFLALGGIAPAIAASQYAIISVEPASEGLEPGRVLEVNDTFDIPPGVTVTLLGDDGTVSAVPGPAHVTITDDGGGDSGDERRSALAKVAGLLAGEDANAQSLGAARAIDDGSNGGGKGIEPWAIPVDRDSNGCARGEEVLLGRDDPRQALPVALEADGELLAELTWPQGDSVLTLPRGNSAELSEFDFRASGSSVRVTLHRLPEDMSENDPLAVLGWMIDSGCDRQAMGFARNLALQAQ